MKSERLRVVFGTTWRKGSRWFLIGLVLFFIGSGGLLSVAISNDQTFPKRVSIASDGTEGTGSSGYFFFAESGVAISADGQCVAFESDATNLIPVDTNDVIIDVFVHDWEERKTTVVSVASDGTQGSSSSGSPALSADGQFVAFQSDAPDLVPGDTNDFWDVFVYDQEERKTTRVSVSSDGIQGNSFSLDPALSANGRFVAFASHASNLVPGDTNETQDIFIHDRKKGKTTRVSVASDGTQANSSSFSPALSANGRFVAFASYASNLVPGDTNGFPDIFIHDRKKGKTTRVSVGSDGTQGNEDSVFPTLSADGRFVAFVSYASNLVPGDTNETWDIFVHDWEKGKTTRVSVSSDGIQGNSLSFDPALSADGQFVAFASSASNLMPGDTNGFPDIFIHDRTEGKTTVVSVASDGTQANSGSFFPVLSADGRFVAFQSDASNLVPGDTNELPDVFVTRNPLE